MGGVTNYEIMKKKKLLISFSGGRTSAYMLWYLFFEWTERNNFEMVVVFANTGKEDLGTLSFVKKCGEVWNIPIVWVESKHLDINGNTYSKRGWRVSFKVVDFYTASRNGEPFEEMISILGIPSTNAPMCTGQLKKKAIHEYLKSLGWSKYWKALGIRYDEPKRVNINSEKLRILYPLISDTVMSKHDILAWWAEQSFNLQIDPEHGNCDNCWKKNKNLLVRNAKKYPDSFEWWQKMTDKYGELNPRNTKLKPPFNFYRGNMSALDILGLAKLSLNEINTLSLQDPESSCSESCEAF